MNLGPFFLLCSPLGSSAGSIATFYLLEGRGRLLRFVELRTHEKQPHKRPTFGTTPTNTDVNKLQEPKAQARNVDPLGDSMRKVTHIWRHGIHLLCEIFKQCKNSSFLRSRNDHRVDLLNFQAEQIRCGYLLSHSKSVPFHSRTEHRGIVRATSDTNAAA